jgi:hypothetical protein
MRFDGSVVSQGNTLCKKQLRWKMKFFIYTIYVSWVLRTFFWQWMKKKRIMVEKRILKAKFNIIIRCHVWRLMRTGYNYIEQSITSLRQQDNNWIISYFDLIVRVSDVLCNNHVQWLYH